MFGSWDKTKTRTETHESDLGKILNEGRRKKGEKMKPDKIIYDSGKNAKKRLRVENSSNIIRLG